MRSCDGDIESIALATPFGSIARIGVKAINRVSNLSIREAFTSYFFRGQSNSQLLWERNREIFRHPDFDSRERSRAIE
ncbi:MAG: hypothetical protein D6728_08410 [Cyanobacteria bacterium J055]|nr:MAG: hypothetical protein D6728_08410 [Cyanobacteria bacterium J055]